MRAQRFLIAFIPFASLALAALTAGDAHSEWAARGGRVETPDSSIEQPEHVGLRAHTNFKMFMPAAGPMGSRSSPASREAAPQVSGPPYAGYFYETPASLACVYRLVPVQSQECDPNTVTANPRGGSRAIAIVDAYHYPTALTDLALFSAQFGLPAPTTGQGGNFQVVYANGRQPRVNANWNLEAALDIQWAHAMAPNAKIYLVEAASNSYADLLYAVSMASNLVASAGGGQVSMSWGGSEFSAQTFYDGYFTRSGVVYFASSGDSPGVIWPAASRNVVSVGGTSLSRDPNTGTLKGELAWQSGGGGPSLYEPLPGFQAGVPNLPQTRRATPDVAAVADPSTGVRVYTSPDWYIVGGTSVSAPVWAGIVNSAGGFAASSQSELATLYGNDENFNDISNGSCGPNQGYRAGQGWDFCTGLGSPTGGSVN